MSNDILKTPWHFYYVISCIAMILSQGLRCQIVEQFWDLASNFLTFYWCFTATIDKWSVNRVRKAKYPSATLMEATSELELSAPDGTTNTSQTWSMAVSRPSKIATSRRKTFLKLASQEPMNCLFLLDSWHWAEPSMRLSLLVFWSRERCVEKRCPTEVLGWIQCIDLLTFFYFFCFLESCFRWIGGLFFSKNYHT